MRKTYKSLNNKHAMTLVEIILVVAIIVILAASVMFGVSKYLNAGNSANSAVSEAAESVKTGASLSESYLRNYNF